MKFYCNFGGKIVVGAFFIEFTVVIYVQKEVGLTLPTARPRWGWLKIFWFVDWWFILRTASCRNFLWMSSVRSPPVKVALVAKGFMVGFGATWLIPTSDSLVGLKCGTIGSIDPNPLLVFISFYIINQDYLWLILKTSDLTEKSVSLHIDFKSKILKKLYSEILYL